MEECKNDFQQSGKYNTKSYYQNRNRDAESDTADINDIFTSNYTTISNILEN